MSNLVFPTFPGRAISVTRKRISQTAVQQTIGRRRFTSTWEVCPLYSYRLTFNFLRSASALQELQALEGFVARLAGRWDSFLWTDPEDCSVTAHPFGKGDGTSKTFQLQRTLVPSASLNPASSRSYWPNFGDGYEPVWEPDTTTDQTYVAGTLTTNTNGANGIVTFASAPIAGAVVTWTGNYWKRVTFASDEFSVDRIVNQVWECKTLEFIGVKP